MFNKTIIFTTVALTLVGSIFALTTQNVYAQEAEPRESLTLSPVNKKYNVDAGKTIEDSLTIINDGQVTYDFIVYARPYSLKKDDKGNVDESYQADFTKTAENTDVYQWVQFKQAKYRLEAGASTKVDYTVRVPSNARPGGHYGVIFAESQPVGGVSGNSVLRNKRVGSILYTTINGANTLKGSVLSTEIPFWQFEPPLKMSSRIKNEGNTDFVDTINYRVKDVFGNVKYESTAEWALLPQTIRKVKLQWDKAAWLGVYRVEIDHKYLDKSELASGYVLILPRYILVIFTLLIVAGGGYGLYRRIKK